MELKSIQEVLVHLEIASDGIGPKTRMGNGGRSDSPLKAEELQALLGRAGDLIKAQVGEIASLKRSIKERDDMFNQFAGGMRQQKELEDAARALGVSNQLV